MKCIEANGDLTALGNILAQLPVEPKYGRMMILGNILMLGEFLSIIAAGSSINYDLFLGGYGNVFLYIICTNEISLFFIF